MGPPSLGPTAPFAEDCLPPELDYDSRDDLLISINAWAATRAMPSQRESPPEPRNCDSLATQQDIYNGIAATKRDVCEGQSSIHALASQLDQEGFWSRIQFGQDGRVTAVLFAHPESLTYLQAYPDVLLLDCTYKTNKHGMPLLDMIGVDACQRSFCIAFAFLGGETEADFVWALDRLRSLYEHHSARLPSVVLTDRCIACMNAVAISFPTSCSLLCLWHANKAVLRYCRPAFVRQDQPESTNAETIDTSESNGWSEFYQFWHSIMAAPNEEAFKDRATQFEKKYLPNHLKQVGYIKTFWLEGYKEKLVKAWVDQHAHFGNTVTSRVEGIHALLKAHLKKSTLNLFEAWRAMKHALLNQLSDLRSNQARQQIRVPIELSGPLYASVRGWVSHEALRKVEEQRKMLETTSSMHSRSVSPSEIVPSSQYVQAALDAQEPELATEPPTDASLATDLGSVAGTLTILPTTAPDHPPAQSGQSFHAEIGSVATTFPGDQDSGPVPGPPRDATELLVSPPPISPDLPAPPPPKYDSPEAIHKSYTAARSAWYAAQPAGSIKTNQQYRKAMRLPARHCATTTGLRAWTKEEMMAYLDWSHAEDQRVEAQIMKEMGDNPLANTRKGVADIWRQVEKDSREQETLYSAHVEADDCIFVEP
ncbi:MULE transposase domain-containing protein [Hirsutella rhossiliensis]|uniref:MULE transposase domain-containing protein n=1 Tax=Hirsutella rhossiliensis TaxID=111463 RepID=A0A9P8MQC7_9HYPO|nr:MULE transposase domain-containing protein [Hirsutella rhossiliensis]KAH0959828.1 MULE transposase domain-containing protein [Hirsutella rhossiliensis]